MNPKQIDPQTLDAIKQQLDIVEIISDHVSLKDKNQEHLGLCPFHAEKSPSFTVNREKGVYYCFGCGEKGDAIAFLMSLNRTSFVETVAILAERYNIPLAENTDDAATQRWREENQVKQRILKINEAACKFFEQAKDKSKLALEYLQQRGLKPETIEKFRLGYALEQGNTLLDHLKSEFSLQQLSEAGVIKYSEKSQDFYDVFRDRLMVPLFDPQGRVIGFSGRALRGDIQPKYLNTSDTPVFKKSEVIYPFHLAREHIVRQDTGILVEGNFDVILLHQIGVQNAIASLGTAINQKILRRLSALTKSKTLILGLDNDPPGIKATSRIIDNHLEAIGSDLINFRILSLPTGFKDVDEVIATPNGTSCILELIAQSQLWVDWRLQNILKEHDLTKANGFNQGKKALIELLKQIHDLSLRSFYLDKITKILGGNSQNLETANLHRQHLLQKINTSSLTKTEQEARSGVARVPRVAPTEQEASPMVELLKGLDTTQVKILSCEILLTKINLFLPEYNPLILEKLKEADWFVRDPLCRWMLNHTCSHEGVIYQIVDLRNQLARILEFPEIFAEVAEFLNCDYQRDRSLINAKIDCLFSRSRFEMIQLEQPVENIAIAIKNLFKVKCEQQIAAAQVMLELAQTPLEQQFYLNQIGKLKTKINKIYAK
jgi:DNA primase